MDTVDATQALNLFASRLTTLSALFDKVQVQWSGRDLDELSGARLTSDMYCLAQQVSATCSLPMQFLQWCRGVDQPLSMAEPGTWEQSRAVLRDTLAQVTAAAGEGLAAPANKRIVIPSAGVCLDLTARRYLEDWLLPNFYFHLTAAYAILRAQGAQIGKADYMMHVVGDFRPIAAAADA